jgi:DNA transposition AAA+ family ATPase
MELKIKKNIATTARKFLLENNVTQTILADKCGVPKEYFSQILKVDTDFTINAGKGKMVTIADKYFERIASFLGLSLTDTFWQIKQTPQLTMIIHEMYQAKQNGRTILVVGETGAGKTITANLLLKRYPADTYLVTVGSTDNLSDLIDKVLEQLNITTGPTKSKRLNDITKKLRKMREDGFNPQIIFDESEYMKPAALCSMKELYDHVNEFASIAMIGTEQLITNLDKLRRRNKPGIPQFYRRIKFGIRNVPDVDRTFKLFLDGLSTEVKSFLRKICENYGELHDVLVPVRREAERLDKEIDVNFIRLVLNLPNTYGA